MIKTCRTCGTQYNHTLISHDYYCPQCRSAYYLRMRDAKRARGVSVSGSIKPKEYYREYRQRPQVKAKMNSLDERAKRAAQHLVQRAVAKGVLTRQPCQCGRTDVHGHHEDYLKPLEVEWLCPKCHKARHKQDAPAAQFQV